MNYLFGDSTPSELTSNFLEFFRDALDFSVHALQADERIRGGERRSQTLRDEADVEIERLTKFISLALEGVDTAEKAAGGDLSSPTAACAPKVRDSIEHAQRSSLNAIREQLAAEIARVEADEAATRNACLAALVTLLRPHDPPDAKATVRISLGGAGAYEARRDARAAFGLEWSFGLAIPSDDLWSAPLRVERITQGQPLEIRAPQLTGFFSKEVKVKPQRIERYLITELVDDGAITSFSVRAELGSPIGIDFSVEGGSIKALRVGPEGDASVGSFDVQPEDAPKLIEVAQKLRATTINLEQKELLSARAGDADFVALPDFVAFVESFVAMMTPIVREIAERSLTPNELIIRRLLTNDRREEIFVSKATLREKYADLAAPLRSVFAPLGLDSPTLSSRPPPVRVVTEKAAVRAELPKSLPPPPPDLAAPQSVAKLPSSRISSSDLKTMPIATVQPILPPVTSPPVKSPPISTPELTPASDGTRNEPLVGALKKIALLSRSGRVEEAYREYETIFSSTAFEDYRPDDQRQALRLMVFAKSPPPVTDIVREAHRAALGRIEALIKVLEDPADYEVLGVTQLTLGNDAAALEAFSKALNLERVKNPQSELCGNLMKRVAAL